MGVCVIHVYAWVYVYVYQTQICMSLKKTMARVAIVTISLFEMVVFNAQLVNYLLIDLD